LLSLLKARLEITRVARDWRLWSKAIAKAARKVLGLCEVYVFGSVVEGRMTGGSDVDVLIVVDVLPENFAARANLVAEIEELARLPLYHPFEIHLVTRKEADANSIYRKAASKGTLISVELEGEARHGERG